MPRRKDYRAYWCGVVRCFLPALWYNGTPFHRWASLTQILLLAVTPVAIILPWLEISYETGNHLERVRPIFALIDGNGDNTLDYYELSSFLKDMGQVFFGLYFRNNAEMVRAVLADRSSDCLRDALIGLQATCAIGDRAVCLQRDNWIVEGGNPMQDPVKIQDCLTSLMDAGYLARTGDNCVSDVVKTDWLNSASNSAAANCVRSTRISIEEFSLFGRHLVLGLSEAEKRVANHCINVSYTTYMSIYGAMTVRIKVKLAPDLIEPRCHSVLSPLKARKIPLENFTCTTTIDYWAGRGVDLGDSSDPLKPPQPPRCRALAQWIDDVFEYQYLDFGCNISCTPGGKALLSQGCIPSKSVGQRLDRKISSPVHPACTTRIGSGAVGDDCRQYATCPSCSYPTNFSGLVPDVTSAERVHPGSSGMSAIYDTMCVIGESIYIRDLRDIVKQERARDDVARSQGIYFKSQLVLQCERKIKNGDFADGELEVAESTKLMAAFPDDNPGLKKERFECKCRVNAKCTTCINSCVDASFFLPKARTAYKSVINCNSSKTLNQVVRIEGAAAFPVQKREDPTGELPKIESGPYNKTNPTRWVCLGASCSLAPGAVTQKYPYTGSVVEYASPLPVLGVWQLFLVLCPVGLVVVLMYVSSMVLQFYNFWMMWRVLRSSDDLDNADSWRQEQFVLKGFIFSGLILFTPAILYGAYIAARGDTLRWASLHHLQVGWYLSILLSFMAIIPFYGAWKSFKLRPREWRNAVSRFQTVKGGLSLASVVPGDVESGAAGKGGGGKQGKLPSPKRMQVVFLETKKPQAQDHG